MNAAVALGAVALLYSAWRRRHALPPIPLPLIDAPTTDAVVDLVTRLERGDGADALAIRLTKLLQRFPPDEAVLRRLSTFQQRLEGTGARAEYAVTCMYVLASEVVANGYHRKPAVGHRMM